jgi:hypothetical protein
MDQQTYYRIWDRKTARHHWRLVVETLDSNHAAMIFDHHVTKLRDWGEWPNGQVGQDIAEHDTIRVMDKGDFQQPANTPMIRIVSV